MDNFSRTFEDIAYLASGNERQKDAFAVLTKGQVMEHLKDFDPLLVGTVPIGIDVEGSDLDIICSCGDNKAFQEVLVSNFSACRSFRIWNTVIGSAETVLASFFLEGWEIEIFGQKKPSREQNGYRHMIAEQRLLVRYGQSFKDQVIALKEKGIKTEPAFAMVLNLKGDPYQALLNLDL